MRLSGPGICLWAITLSACHVAAWRQQRADAERARQDLPSIRRIAEQAPESSQTFEIDDKTGRSKVSLVLRLDYFPPSSSGQTTSPVCLAPLDAQVELGSVSCEGQADTAKPLYAKNVEQDCYTSNRDEKRNVSAVLNLQGCKRGVITLHRFEPALRLDQEVRDSGA